MHIYPGTTSLWPTGEIYPVKTHVYMNFLVIQTNQSVILSKYIYDVSTKHNWLYLDIIPVSTKASLFASDNYLLIQDGQTISSYQIVNGDGFTKNFEVQLYEY